MHSKIIKIRQRFLAASDRVLLLSIGISTILPLIAVAVMFPLISANISTYSDFIAGETTITGYFKRGDMIIFAVYMVMYLILFFSLPLVLPVVIKNKNLIDDTSLMPGIKNQALFFLLSFIVFCAVFFAFNKTIPLVMVLASFSLIYYILNAYKVENITEIFAKLCLISGFGYFSIIAGGIILKTIFTYTPYIVWFNDFFKEENERIFIVYTILVFILVFAYAKKKISEKVIGRILTLFQVLLPALLLALYHSSYNYHGNIVFPAHSVTFRNTLLITAATMILYNIYIL